MTTRPPNPLRALPAVQAVLASAELAPCQERYGHERLAGAVRAVLAALRARLLAGERPEHDLPVIAAAVAARLQAEERPRLRRVINATGVVLHTNLGRAPLCERAIEQVAEIARGYSNLEYELGRGERGERYAHVEELICRLTGAEAAIVVNNNAAAVLLVLAALAAGREVVASRGQLIEIGGSFRLPEVIAHSGARLVEVGTTNKTRLGDYEAAIGAQTALLLRSHPSNFRVVGFTEEVPAAELARLGAARGVPTYEDQGSGVLVDLARHGLPPEHGIAESLREGIDLVSCSGDKLLGGPQAGIVCGRREAVAQLRRHPLLRALRIDKLTLAALEATLLAYLDAPRALRELPVLRMLTSPPAQLAEHAGRLADRLARALAGAAQVVARAGDSETGGGSLPGVGLPTTLVAVRPRALGVDRLACLLRAADPPLIARVADDELLLDPRTLLAGEDDLVVAALVRALVPHS